MRRLLLALAAAGLLVAPSASARAAEQADPCVDAALDAAMPALMQSYQYSPQGYGPFGYAPLTYPFGVGPYGVGAFFGGRGVPYGSAPAFGPLGPGLTANAIARNVIAPTGTPLNTPANVGTLISLAQLQQAEMATLNARYSNAAYYQTAAATWANSYATEAAATYTRVLAQCQNRQPSPGPTAAQMAEER
jgi:hypothetical protein